MESEGTKSVHKEESTKFEYSVNHGKISNNDVHKILSETESKKSDDSKGTDSKDQDRPTQDLAEMELKLSSLKKEHEE